MISKRHPLYFLFIIYPRGGSWSVNSPRRNFHQREVRSRRGENPRGKVGISAPRLSEGRKGSEKFGGIFRWQLFDPRFRAIKFKFPPEESGYFSSRGRDLEVRVSESVEPIRSTWGANALSLLTVTGCEGGGEIFVAEIQRYKVSTKRPGSGNSADPYKDVEFYETSRGFGENM